MRRLNLFTRRRSRRRGRFAYLISLLMAGGTGVFLWGGQSRLPLPEGVASLVRQFLPAASAPVAPAGAWELYFSPNGGATEAIVREIGAARQRIRVQAYSFTSAPIAKALAKAKARGVDVQVILDKSQRSERYTSATYLLNQRVTVLIDAEHAIAHDKVMIFDGETVITGSFNFTKSAESRNSENVLILRHAKELAVRYEANWAHHAAHSRPYERPVAEAPRLRSPGVR